MVVQSAGLPDGVRLLSLGAVVAVSGLSYSTVSQSSPGLQYNNIDRHSLPPSLPISLSPSSLLRSQPQPGQEHCLVKNISSEIKQFSSDQIWSEWRETVQ